MPDSLSLGGITLYGTIDSGYAYQSDGVPLSSKYLGGLEQPKVGIRVEIPVGSSFNFKVARKLETTFNPLSGQLVDACGSIADNSGVA